MKLKDMNKEELYRLIYFIGNGTRPVTAANKLFGKMVIGRISLTKDLRNYAWNKITYIDNPNAIVPQINLTSGSYLDIANWIYDEYLIDDAREMDYSRFI